MLKLVKKWWSRHLSRKAEEAYRWYLESPTVTSGRSWHNAEYRFVIWCRSLKYMYVVGKDGRYINPHHPTLYLEAATFWRAIRIGNTTPLDFNDSRSVRPSEVCKP